MQDLVASVGEVLLNNCIRHPPSSLPFKLSRSYTGLKSGGHEKSKRNGYDKKNKT